MNPSARLATALVVLALRAESLWAAQEAATQAPLPTPGLSAIRVFGALIFVLALFFLSAWLFRNWQRITRPRGSAPRLSVLEVRSLGHRHALYVIGYEEQRLLVASSPAGIALITHLPAAEATTELAVLPQAPTFAAALQQVFNRS